MNALCAKYENRKYSLCYAAVSWYIYVNAITCQDLSNERERSKHLKSELKRAYCIYERIQYYVRIWIYLHRPPIQVDTHRCYQFNVVIYDVNTA